MTPLDKIAKDYGMPKGIVLAVYTALGQYAVSQENCLDITQTVFSAMASYLDRKEQESSIKERIDDRLGR